MKKHVIILHTDQQRFDSLGCNGNETAKTPNLDNLAKEGCNFSRHIAANTVCMPSRASLLTGMYPNGHCVTSNGIPLWKRKELENDEGNIVSKQYAKVELKDKVPTFANILKDKGYKTALFGKLHLEPHLADGRYGFYESYTNWQEEEMEFSKKPYYGFTTNKIILGHGEAPCGYNRGHYGRWLQKKHPKIAKLVDPGENANTMSSSERGDIYVSNLPSKYHNTKWLADEACEYLDTNSKDEEPIFMFVGFPDPHHPFTPPKDIYEEFLDIDIPEFAKVEKIVGEKPEIVKKAMKRYSASDKDIETAYKFTAASVNLIDQSVGQIVKKLKDLGIYEDTTIIFTADHGDFLGDFGMLAKDNFAFNSLLHIPFIVKPHKGIKLPKTKDTPMSNVDVIPTILSMIDLKTPSYIQGVDIFDEKNKDNKPMATCYGVTKDQRNLTLYDQNFRYTFYSETGEEELYNHILDPKEERNLAYEPTKENKKICDEFKSQLFLKHIKCDDGTFNHYGLW